MAADGLEVALAMDWRAVASESFLMSVGEVMKPISERLAGMVVSRSTWKLAVLEPRLARPQAATISDWMRLRMAAAVSPSA